MAHLPFSLSIKGTILVHLWCAIGMMSSRSLIILAWAPGWQLPLHRVSPRRSLDYHIPLLAFTRSVGYFVMVYSLRDGAESLAVLA
jgi:hypothetical protein